MSQRILLYSAVLLAGIALPPSAGAQCQGQEIFADDLESGDGAGWTTYFEVVGDANLCAEEWHLDNTLAHSGTWSWSNMPYGQAGGVDGTGQCLNYVELDAFAVPGNTETISLTFWHRYSIEENFDFGFIEVSSDGANWTSVTNPGYTGTSTNNGLEFVEETVTFDSTFFVPGGNLSVRFMFLSDQAAPDLGWSFDDLTVTACVGAVPVEWSSWGGVKSLYRSPE